MEHPLASLSEGGGTAKAVTEGVSFVIYDTPPVCFASSPLKEGVKQATGGRPLRNVLSLRGNEVTVAISCWFGDTPPCPCGISPSEKGARRTLNISSGRGEGLVKRSDGMEKLDILIVVLALVLCGMLLIFTFSGDALATGSWGLSFQVPGQAPAGPASAETLKKLDGAYLGDTSQPVIYLTFDAGYENGHTAKILDVLKKHDAPAAFFLVGHYLEQNPDLVRRMVAEGHTVGNHTMHHPDMSRLTDKEAFSKELEDLEGLYREVTGQELPKFYRPHQGIYSEENLAMAQELGYRTVFWSLAYADWDNNSQPTRQQAFSKLLPRIHPGAIVLLHSTSQTNAEILHELLTKWEEMGYTFAPIEEAFAS